MLTREEKFAKLTAVGFRDTPDCDVLTAFHAPSLAFDSRMSIQGSFEDEQAYIYYSQLSPSDGGLEGFFHAPSLLERMLNCYPGEFDIKRILRDINRELGDEVSLVYVGTLPMIYIELTYYDFEIDQFASALSTMCKLVGALDYVLSRKIRQLEAKHKPQ